MSKKVGTVEKSLNHAEDALNKVLSKIHTFKHSSDASELKKQINNFAEEYASYLFFGKSLKEFEKQLSLAGSNVKDITEEVATFMKKIGLLYVAITDFDEDGKPLLDISAAKFVKKNGKYTLSLDDVIDKDDVNIVTNGIHSFADAVSAKDTGAVLGVALDSMLGIAEYSMKIQNKIDELNITQVFRDMFATIKRYPDALRKSFKFNTVVSLAAGLIFSGIMLFMVIGISNIKDAKLQESLTIILNNRSIKAQIKMSVELITDAMTGEDVKGKKICFCIPLCCGDAPEPAISNNLQDDLDALIKLSEAGRKKTSESDGEIETKVAEDVDVGAGSGLTRERSGAIDIADMTVDIVDVPKESTDGEANMSTPQPQEVPQPEPQPVNPIVETDAEEGESEKKVAETVAEISVDVPITSEESKKNEEST